MVVQDHLRLARAAHASGAPRLAFGQVLEEVVAERIVRGRRMPAVSLRARGAGTSATARGASSAKPASPNSGFNAGSSASRSASRQRQRVAVREQARAVDVGATIGGIGAQPRGAGRVAGVDLPRQRRDRPGACGTGRNGGAAARDVRTACGGSAIGRARAQPRAPRQAAARRSARRRAAGTSPMPSVSPVSLRSDADDLVLARARPAPRW